jgi:DNA-directed RNA polymerase beta subunit
MNDVFAWNMIERYFLDEPQNLVKHHIQSYNDFYKNGIFQIFKEKNPTTIYAKLNEKTKEYENKIDIYFGGKDGQQIFFGKPVIYDNQDNVHYMYPNEARLRNMTYSMTIHYNIEYEVTYHLEKDEPPQFFHGGKKIKVGGGDDSDSDDDNSSVDFYADTPINDGKKTQHSKIFCRSCRRHS